MKKFIFYTLSINNSSEVRTGERSPGRIWVLEADLRNVDLHTQLRFKISKCCARKGTSNYGEMVIQCVNT